MSKTQENLDKVVRKLFSRNNVHEVCLHLESKDGQKSMRSYYGDIPERHPFYIASINKLFVAALVLRLADQKKIHLDNHIDRLLPPTLSDGLHVFKGTDYSDAITVRHLLSHTSGLPCYVIDRHPDGTFLMKRLQQGEDIALPIEQAVRRARAISPKFAPGTPGKAHYSNTNYRLLATIVEELTGIPIEKQLQQVFRELQMSDTFVIGANEPRSYTPVRYRDRQLVLDAFFGASRYDIASTTLDLIRFLRAYLSGHFFAKSFLPDMQHWNRIFFPFHYGMGLQRFSVPRILSPFQSVPEMIGHSGSVGSILFYIPERQVFVAGTTNQLASPQIIYRGVIKALGSF